MVRESEIREGELAVEVPAPRDAGLIFIGRIRTPWTSRLETPRQAVTTARSAGWRSSSHGCRP
jgi:hypothetical protein